MIYYDLNKSQKIMQVNNNIIIVKIYNTIKNIKWVIIVYIQCMFVQYTPNVNILIGIRILKLEIRKALILIN